MARFIDPFPCPPISQSLSTCKLTQAQALDMSLDLLTGFQLVDGKERMIVIEGLESGAMKIVKVWGPNLFSGRKEGGYH